MGWNQNGLNFYEIGEEKPTIPVAAEKRQRPKNLTEHEKTLLKTISRFPVIKD